MRVQSAHAVDHPTLGAGAITGAQELGPFPDNQVAQTIGRMRRRVLEDRYDEDFMNHARRILGPPGANDVCTRAWAETRRAISFMHDKELAEGMGVNPDNVVEVVIRPKEMAKLVDRGTAAGDCDDFCMYCAALCESQGIPCSFVTVAADSDEPDQYSHVYVRAYPYAQSHQNKGSYVAIDSSHGPYCGWEVPNEYGKLREWPVDDGLGLWFGMTVEIAAASAFIGFVIWAVWGAK